MALYFKKGKMAFTVLAVAVITTLLSCESQDGPSILGQWEMNREKGTVRYNFKEGNSLATVAIVGNDTTVEEDQSWMMHKDTLYMWKNSNHEAQPGVVIVEQLDENKMIWHPLMTEARYTLKRIRY